MCIEVPREAKAKSTLAQRCELEHLEGFIEHVTSHSCQVQALSSPARKVMEIGTGEDLNESQWEPMKTDEHQRKSMNIS